MVVLFEKGKTKTLVSLAVTAFSILHNGKIFFVIQLKYCRTNKVHVFDNFDTKNTKNEVKIR